MMQAYQELDLVLASLRLAQADYDWARSRGDAERVAQVRVKLRGITAEHDRLVRRTIHSPVSARLG
jgi:hypothetical protein